MTISLCVRSLCVRGAAALCVLAVAAASCGGAAEREAAPPPAAAPTLAVADRANATAAVASRGAFVVTAWSASLPDGSADIYAAVSRDAGATFGPPVRVNDVERDARAAGEQPPRLALAGRTDTDPVIVVVWTSRRDGGTALLRSRSEDGGASFAAATVVAGTDAPGNRGWHDVAIAQAADNASVVWLDHREHAQAASTVAATHHEHGAAASAIRDGVAMAQKSSLYVGSLDGSTPPRALAAGVCYCCKTALAAGPGGALYAAWRHVYPGNIRDIAFTVSRDGGRTFGEPVRISDDRWVLNGCPENGPAMAVAPGGRVHVVWPTLVNGDGLSGEPALSLFHASSDDGRTFTPRQALPTEGVPRHPQIAIAANGTLVVAWDEAAAGTRRIAVARASVDDDGGVRFTRDAVIDDDRATYPALAPAGNGAVVAWSSGDPQASVIRVQRISW